MDIICLEQSATAVMMLIILMSKTGLVKLGLSQREGLQQAVLVESMARIYFWLNWHSKQWLFSDKRVGWYRLTGDTVLFLSVRSGEVKAWVDIRFRSRIHRRHVDYYSWKPSCHYEGACSHERNCRWHFNGFRKPRCDSSEISETLRLATLPASRWTSTQRLGRNTRQQEHLCIRCEFNFIHMPNRSNVLQNPIPGLFSMPRFHRLSSIYCQ